MLSACSCWPRHEPASRAGFGNSYREDLAGMIVHLKRLALLLLPPIMVIAIGRLRRWVRGAVGGQPEWEAVPDSDAIWQVDGGWSHQSIADTQSRKWPSFLASVAGAKAFGQPHEGAADAEADLGAHNTIVTFGYVVGRVASGRSTISVLDWGGGLGHYGVYAAKLQPDLKISYVIKDLPSLCVAGRAVLPDAEFVDDDTAALARRYDLVFASSSLHYTRDVYGLLAKLCAAASGWLMITRTPFVEHHDDFVVVQRPHAYGYMTEYPGWFLNRKRVVEFIVAQGFTLEREFLVAERPFVANAPEPGQYRGLLFRRDAVDGVKQP